MSTMRACRFRARPKRPFRYALRERGLLWPVGLSRRQNLYRKGKCHARPDASIAEARRWAMGFGGRAPRSAVSMLQR